MKKAFTLIEIIIVIFIIAFLTAFIVPIFIVDTKSIENERTAQVISTDSEGNRLWRVWDEYRGYIYYMPHGETSWDGGGKGSNPMGVK